MKNYALFKIVKKYAKIKNMEGVNQEYLEELKQKSRKKLNEIDLYQFKGSVSKLLGLTVEVKLPGLKIGDLCYIEAATGEKKPAEVVAFKGDVAQLQPV